MASQDWIEKDFYKILGVTKGVSDADLKKAYRKLAKDNHPDLHPGDQAAESRFKDISLLRWRWRWLWRWWLCSAARPRPNYFLER